MSRLRALLTLGAAGLLCGGCVAAAIPIVAGAAIGGDALAKRKAKSKKEREPGVSAPKATRDEMPPPLATQQARDLMRELEGAKAVPQGTPLPAALPSPGGPPVAGGLPAPTTRTGPARSGETAARSLQAYQALWTYVDGQVAARRGGVMPKSVVLVPGADLEAPRYEPCGSKPLAILFDLDENDEGGDRDARWRRWRGDGSDQLVAVPGAVEGIEAARREGVEAIFMSAREQTGAPDAARLLDQLGLGPVVPGTTLFLRGGVPEMTGDQVRHSVAKRYCVIAIVGDSLSEFSDQFDRRDAMQRPIAATETMIAPLWGAGWFLLPNPVRSTATPTTELPKE